MTKIRVGRYYNQRTHKLKVLYAHLPRNMFIYCKWCGNQASKIMYLIKQESDMDPIEEQYSSVCTYRSAH